MSKEIYISSTPHETRLAIVEDDALSEIYYERENEYTLAGSIYNGRVTRVLPGMQSAFVEIGLERDAFLYITDFMEEVPDSAEFDTTSSSEQRPPRLTSGEPPTGDRADRSERGERNDRGRGRRGGRDRNGSRGERQPERADAAPQTSDPFNEPAIDDQGFGADSYPLVPTESSDAQTGEGGPEGSRRWRGRRGRRRGRGTAPGAPETPHTAGVSAFPDTDSSTDETLFEGGAPLEEETSSYQIEGSAEPAYPSVPEFSENREERRDRGRFDRSRRRGAQGRPEQTVDVRPDSRPEQRTEQRGGRPQRVPRGFTPSRNLYGVDDSEAHAGPDSPEPIILPGESLSKYRKPSDEPAPAASSASPTPPVTVNLARPANLVEVAAGWDGSDVLPGETLSRRRPAEPRASQPDQRRSGSFDRGSRREQRQPFVTATTPSEPGISVPLPAEPVQSAHQPDATEPAVPELPAASPETIPEPAAQEAAHAVAPVAAAPEPVEYEPTEGSVSYRIDPLPPAEFRHTALTLDEPETELAPPSKSGEELPVPAEVHTSLAHSITPAPGVVLQPLNSSDPVTSDASNTHLPALATPELHEPGSTPKTTENLAPTVEHTAHVEALTNTASSDAELEPQPAHDVTSILASGDMHSHLEPAEPQTTAEVAEPQPVPGIFEPGAGELSEEILDEEEPAGATIQASSFEELDDLEEETLEGAADLGSMLRDMSIDQITRVNPETGEELEDFEEDELDEDLQEDTQEELALHEHDSLETSSESDSIASYQSEQQAFDAETGAGYVTEAPASDTYTDPNRQHDRGRRDRRDPRRSGGRGDRRGGSGPGGDRGRGRHSVQSTNLPAISDLLKPGQEILVQIAKEPIAKKGARITSHIALPGRFLVFMPTVNHTGVSRKIESDSERRRLKEILLSEKGEASGGFIVRTAASGATEEELRSDLRFLLNLWSDIKSRSESSKSPALIYHDLNLIERILRDQVTDNFSAIWVDSETEYERVLRFLQRFQPSLIRRVKLYLKDTPLFEQFGISEEINKALRSKVWLKSGGSIVINQTEALVAIDINTGKYVGKTARLEDTIVKTNLDAIPEIVRQIRLRDLGGIIIIDFIDMDERKNRNRVMAALEEELKKDRAPSKVLQFNDFGLVAITRKRVKQSLERTLSTPCSVCQGTGMVKSPITVCNDIYVEMRKMHKHLERGDVMLRVHPEVVKQLKASNARWLHEMEETVGKTILVKSDPSLHPEQFDIH